MGEGKEDMRRPKLGDRIPGHYPLERFTPRHQVSYDDGKTWLSIHIALVVVNPRLQPNQIVVQPQGGVGVTDGIVE